MSPYDNYVKLIHLHVVYMVVVVKEATRDVTGARRLIAKLILLRTKW